MLLYCSTHEKNASGCGTSLSLVVGPERVVSQHVRGKHHIITTVTVYNGIVCLIKVSDMRACALY